MNGRAMWLRFFVTLVAAALPITTTVAFKPDAGEHGHWEATQSAAAVVSATLPSGERLTFTGPALFQVAEANKLTDLNQFAESFHFDNDQLPQASSRIVDSRGRVIAAALLGDGQAARVSLGAALHTLQDFYSHSNWIQLRPGIAPHDNVALFLQAAGSNLGWFGSGGCDDDSVLFNDSTEVTTGYFYLRPAGYLQHPGSGKCLHGLDPLIGGIHKDYPGRLGHVTAYARALDATEIYIQGIIDALMATDPRAVCELMGHPVAVCERGQDDEPDGDPNPDPDPDPSPAAHPIEIYRMRRACTTTPGGGLVWNYNSSTAPNAVPQAATATICAETTRTNRYVTVCRVGDEWIEKSESYDDDWLIGVNINDWLSGNASIASNGVVTINMEFGRDDRYEGPQNFVVYERDYSTTVTVHLSAANPLFGARSAGSFSDRDYNALDPKPGFSGRKSLTLRVIAGGGAGGTVDFAFVRALPAGSDVPNQCTGSTPYPYVAP